MIVHITNGSFFNDWLIKKTGFQCVSFNEAMMSGPVSERVFNESFVCQRAGYHHVSKEDYLNHMKPFSDVINHLDQVDELVLWFGMDAFCQMNLLTIYHLLKINNYKGIVKTVLFDENEPWDTVLSQKPLVTNWEVMSDLYQKVLVEKKSVQSHDS